MSSIDTEFHDNLYIKSENYQVTHKLQSKPSPHYKE